MLFLLLLLFLEPNLLNHTAHSVTKKGVKKRDLSDVELREILSDLLQYVSKRNGKTIR